MGLINVQGKVAIVTGGTRGIGRAIVDVFVEGGARVVFSSRNQADCESLADELNGKFARLGPAVVGQVCDVRDIDALEALVRTTSEVFGQVDCAVSNAADVAFPGPSVDTPETAFKHLLETNIYNNFRFCQMLKPHLEEKGGGSITFITSAAGLVPSPQVLAYGVSKSGQTHLARSLAAEFAPFNIRVNCVAPGLTRTAATTPLWTQEPVLTALINGIPLRRIADPAETASAVLFLASAAGASITGVTIPVDGGLSTIAGSAASTTLRRAP